MEWKISFFALPLFLSVTSAHAVELQLAVGSSGRASSWGGDAIADVPLRLGARFGRVFSLELVPRAGYGTVDDRYLSAIAIQAGFWVPTKKVQPNFHFGIVHQHEEPRAGITDIGHAIFAIGNAIRHRGGFHSSIGLDVEVDRHSWGTVTVGIDANAELYTDNRGPSLYAGAGLWLGMNFDFGGPR